MLDLSLAPRHGGALVSASERYGVALGDWLDLSTGINPHPYPLPKFADADFHRLPEPAALDDLVATARAAYGAGAGLMMAPVPGSDLALRLLPLLGPAGDVAIVAPTYSGHAEAWRSMGRAVHDAASLEEGVARASLVVIVNPNNPDGRSVAPEILLDAAERLAKRGGLLIVDEAFADIAPALSVIPHLRKQPILVLRSFGKFYGLAGLRLGFVVGAGETVGRLKALVGDWPVSGPAITLGRKALADSDWQSATRERLHEARMRLTALLTAAGLEIEGGTDLFVLLRTPSAIAIHEALARRGIWTRIFADQPGRIRIGLPPDEEFGRLTIALGRT